MMNVIDIQGGVVRGRVFYRHNGPRLTAGMNGSTKGQMISLCFACMAVTASERRRARSGHGIFAVLRDVIRNNRPSATR